MPIRKGIPLSYAEREKAVLETFSSTFKKRIALTMSKGYGCDVSDEGKGLVVY